MFSYALLDVDLAFRAIVSGGARDGLLRELADFDEIGFPFTVLIELEILIRCAGRDQERLTAASLELRGITKPIYATKTVSEAFEREMVELIRRGDLNSDPARQNFLQSALWLRSFVRTIRDAPGVDSAIVVTGNPEMATYLGSDDAKLIKMPTLA